MDTPELPSRYLTDGHPAYADRALEVRLDVSIAGLDYDEREELAGAAFTLSGERRELWPEWRDTVGAMVERNERRARDLTAHEAEVLAELEGGAER